MISICKILLYVTFLIGLLVQVEGGRSDIIELGDDKVDWEKIYNLVKENKLPMLSEEEEKKILDDVEKILTEKKSIYGAIKYLCQKIGENKGRYIIYGNPRIKELAVKLMKMKIQCKLKKWVLKQEEKSQEEYIKQIIEIAKGLWNRLISIDGDLCTECYLNDEEEKKELTPPPGMEREFEPENYYWTIGSFFSIVLSTFPENIYDYLWRWDSSSSCLFPEYTRAIVIAKNYPDHFIKEVNINGKIDGNIYSDKGGYMCLDEFFQIIETIINHNKEYTSANKKEIKSAVQKCLFPSLGYCELTLKVYEQIGEKEDIEIIKKIGEIVMSKYTEKHIQELKEFDEKRKNEILDRVKKFQDRVNVLIDKISRQ